MSHHRTNRLRAAVVALAVFGGGALASGPAGALPVYRPLTAFSCPDMASCWSMTQSWAGSSGLDSGEYTCSTARTPGGGYGVLCYGR